VPVPRFRAADLNVTVDQQIMQMIRMLARASVRQQDQEDCGAVGAIFRIEAPAVRQSRPATRAEATTAGTCPAPSLSA